MLQYAFKVIVSALIIVAVSELGKRSSFWGALLTSLPLTSLMAFIWIWRDTGNTEAIASLSHGIFWMVIAALPLFLILPALLRNGVGFWSALGLSCLVTVGVYFALTWVLGRFGVRI
ncbi:DUF3147 family protein [Rhodanobacter sp. 7MK24]|uniref:DUF3147 family protein n=1 Tax=Rhodanobacter sp. 7MK24 TaxID=2775922 RepID=UPI00178407E4|nr:DUF3147 family protein [Rhodanobacter sp. 7MK24]MBD8881781.1 DUF3147 family protein [Rhodanobacter sp. 7MK24]